MVLNASTSIRRGGKGVSRVRILVIIALGLALVAGYANSALALRAPVKADDGTATYYYVSDGIKDNGDFPNTYVAFYWKDNSGNKTITYNGKQCNTGGYGDSGSSNVKVTVFGINTSGTVDSSNVLYSKTAVSQCHGGDTRDFKVNIGNSKRDERVGLTGVVVRVSMEGKGRAFFTLTTDSDNADGTSAKFGALGTINLDNTSNTTERPIGYSRDFNSNQDGFYNITLNFGALCSAVDLTGLIKFYDVDHGNKYQSKTMTFRIKDVETDAWLKNTNSRYSDLTRISKTSNDTTFAITSGSGSNSSAKFKMEANKRYMLEVRNISEMNDIAISIPTNEIYGKQSCGEFTTTPKIQAKADDGSWRSSNFDVSRGDVITWQHAFTAIGPGNPPNIVYGYGDNATSGTQVVADSKAAWSRNFDVGGGTTPWQSSPTYTIPSNAANGAKYCRMTFVSPRSGSDISELASAELCAVVKIPPVIPNVIPMVTIETADNVISPGSSYTVTTRIKNESTSAANISSYKRTVYYDVCGINWRYEPNNSPNGSNPVDTDCLVSVHTDSLVEAITTYATPFSITGSGTYNATSGAGWVNGQKTFTATTIPSNVKSICVRLDVTGVSPTTVKGANANAAYSCKPVAKYPSLQVAGGPVRTGGAFSSSATTCSLSNVSTENNDPYGILMHNYSPTTRGSFGLAALSVGRIEYFGSSNIPISTSPLSRSLLFAAPTPPFNVSGTSFGLFMGAPNADGNLSTYCLPNLAATYKRAVPASTQPTTNAGAKPPAVPANTSRVIEFTGNGGIFTLSAATLPANQRVIIVVTQGEESTNNTVRITGNISYGGGLYAYGTKPPQFVLLVDGDIDIEVAAGVTELNGIYSTKGNIYTCDASGKAATDTLTTATCNQQLTVKGTMIAAKQILPYRTYGFDTTANTNPAEQFRLTPETLLSDYLWSQESLSIRTVLQRELPTRL